MSKILFCANNDVGIYNFRKDLIELLISEGYEVYISVPYGSKIDNLVSIGCKYVQTSFDRRSINPLMDLRLMLFYRKLIYRIAPDVVLTYTIKPNIYGGIVCSLIGVPYLCNITGLGTAVENKGIIQKIILMMYHHALKKARIVFFQNQQNLKYLKQKRIVDNNTMLLPGSGVNLNQFSQLVYPNENAIVFSYFGRVMKAKGVEEYCTAARIIRDRYQNVQFHIYGILEQDYESKLISLQNDGIVTYHGIVSDIREYLCNTHCIIHPSHHEGMSNVILESAASARPVIASDIPGCREAVENEVSGYLFQKGDIDSLIKRIEQFIALSWEQKQKMGIAGRNKMEREFDRNIVVNAYMEEIRKCYGE